MNWAPFSLQMQSLVIRKSGQRHRVPNWLVRAMPHMSKTPTLAQLPTSPTQLFPLLLLHQAQEGTSLLSPYPT